jgi:hypothetical protein
MSSTEHRLRRAGARALVPLLMALGACGPAAPSAPVGADPTVAAPPAPSAPADPREQRLDAFGNLRGTGKLVMGFELPVGAERLVDGVQGPVYYVDSNRERLIRYFRSRGHSLIERMDGIGIVHTGRTLRDASDVPREAQIRASQGPGPGWTLRFDKGTPTPLAKPALIALIEAEGASAPEGAPGEAVAPLDPPAGVRPGEDGQPLEDAQGVAAGSGAKPARAGASGANPTAASRDALKREALGRPVDPKRGRDRSEAIYEYVKANPGRGFLD